MPSYDPHEDLIPEGEYSAVIVSAEDKDSKAGNPMTVVKLEVYDDDGHKSLVTDYIVRPFGTRRLKQLNRVLGEDPNSGELDLAQLTDLNCFVKIGIQEDDKYGDKNTVRRYARADEVATKEAEKTEANTPVEAPF